MPVVWLIDAYRAGERSQVRALVQALGWPCEIRPLQYRQWDVITHLLPGGSLRGIQRTSRESLQPPWPDLVISCGVRNEPVCRWIREQSGGRCRYVHIGRPWADPSAFDLVITTPQYRVPERPNVVRNTLTLHQVSQPRMAQGAAEWADAWRDLPRPFTGVMVGGNSGPFTLGPKAANRLAQQASQLANDTGGSLLVTTSSRTSARATGALLNALDAPHYFHAWQPGGEAGAGRGNPYWGILGTADRFIVTADSIAMLSEACASGKPVDMFDLGGMHTPAAGPQDFRLGGALYQALIRWGWEPLTRDITLVHRELVASGRAAWLGEERQPRKVEISGDMERALRAVKALFDQFDTTCVLD
jgi:mitochondrial fission protein ELM1